MRRFFIIIINLLILYTFIVTLPDDLIAKDFHVTNELQFQEALSMAAGNNEGSDTIYLAAGIYQNRFEINSFRYISDEINQIQIKPENGFCAKDVIIDVKNADNALILSTSNNINYVIENITFQNTVDEGVFISTIGNVEIHNCIFFSGEYSLYIHNVNSLNMSNNLFKNNDIAFDVVKSKDISVTYNSFIENKCGITVYNGKNVSIMNNIICKNIGSLSSNISHGGVRIYFKGKLSIINNTIAFNQLRSTTGINDGGGLYLRIEDSNAITQIYNNIFWNNYAKGGGDDIYISGFGSNTSVYNNVYKQIAGAFDEASGNMNEDPMFVGSDNNDYHLSKKSPCINLGYNDAPNLPETDIDGNPRINENIIDIGAYEFTKEKIPSDQNEDWILTSEEFNAYAEAWRKGETWNSGPDPIPIDYVTRSGYLQKKGETYKNEGGKKPVCWKPDDNNTKR
jgi:hypothetical protein